MKLKIKSKISLSLLSVLLSCHFLFGQVSTFYQTYDFGGADKAYALAATQDGGYIMSGYHGLGIGVNRILVIKTDSLGNEEWHKIYGNSARNVSRAVISLPDGGYMIGAETSGEEFSGDFEDVFLLRLDENGDTLWTKTYMTDGVDGLFDLKLCPDGGFIVAGYRLEPDSSFADGYALKVDSFGNQEWNKSYTIGEDFELFIDVEVLPDSGFIFRGEADLGLPFVKENWILRTDADGEEIWSKTYGWDFFESGRGGLIATHDAIISAGSTTSFSNNSYNETYVLKTNLEGDTIWTKIIQMGNAGFSPRSLTLANDGNYLLAMYDYNDNTSGDVALVKMTPSGEVMWIRTIIDGNDFDSPHDIVQASDGGILISGETSTSAFLIKVTEEGFLSSVNENASAINLEAIIYPNPGYGIFHITSPEMINVFSIEIYNMMGQLARIQSNSNTTTSFTIDISDCPNGAYLFLFKSKSGIVKREIVVKVE